MDGKTMELVRKIEGSTENLFDLGKGLEIIYDHLLDSAREDGTTGRLALDDITGHLALLDTCRRDIEMLVSEIYCSVQEIKRAKAA
mgnify:CR=1 FL=1